jgi:hypothetical protein
MTVHELPALETGIYRHAASGWMVQPLGYCHDANYEGEGGGIGVVAFPLHDPEQLIWPWWLVFEPLVFFREYCYEGPQWAGEQELVEEPPFALGSLPSITAPLQIGGRIHYKERPYVLMGRAIEVADSAVSRLVYHGSELDGAKLGPRLAIRNESDFLAWVCATLGCRHYGQEVFCPDAQGSPDHCGLCSLALVQRFRQAS